MPQYNRFDMRRVIEEYVINPRYRKVLLLKLCEGYTYEETAEMTNYSTQHVKSICKQYKGYLLSLL